MGDLPEGRRGRVLAVLLLVSLLAGAWVGVVAPLIEWHHERAERIERETGLLGRMQRVAGELPALRSRAQNPETVAKVALLEGATDSVAGAVLQQRLQQIGTDVGARFASTEALPGEQIGAYRRIGVRLSVSAPWPVIVRLFEAIAAASPRMLVNDIQIQSANFVSTDTDPSLNTSLVVFGFRAGAGT